MSLENELIVKQIRDEQASYRKVIEVELRSLVREVNELLNREDKPDWGAVQLMLNNARGKAGEIVNIDRRNEEERLRTK